uniref:Zgc:77056 n=1 Tax=Amphilophus citrinellus TaxID=61819 RepID=A0A3Q0R9M7_AMPCI
MYGVAWVKPAEPSFLKKFKNDVGFKEGPNVDTKRQVMPTLDDDSGSDKEDELPQVVVLKSGDLTADEAKKIKDGEAPPDGKILFKKPAKRSSSDKFQGISASSSKKKKSNGGDKEKEEEKKEASGRKVKNNSLLSFGGDEEEED